MSKLKFCQSCSMPMDGLESWGTEKDGGKNPDYCKFCYQDGHFTHPNFTLKQMIDHMIKRMEGEKLPSDILESAVKRLPHLKRWKRKSSSSSLIL